MCPACQAVAYPNSRQPVASLLNAAHQICWYHSADHVWVALHAVLPTRQTVCPCAVGRDTCAPVLLHTACWCGSAVSAPVSTASPSMVKVRHADQFTASLEEATTCAWLIMIRHQQMITAPYATTHRQSECAHKLACKLFLHSRLAASGIDCSYSAKLHCCSHICGVQ